MSKMEFNIDWLDGWSNFKKMFKDPSSTKHILALAKAMNGPALKRSYSRLLETEEGTNIATSFPEIADLYEHLVDCQSGTVGNAILSNQNSIEVLIRLSRLGTRNRSWINRKHPYIWMARRFRDTHDIWHVLTGYDMDFFGEICLAAFSYGQTKAYQWGLICVMGVWKLKTSPKKLLAVYEAYRRGRKCSWLLAENYEHVLKENLDDCRKRLNIFTAKRYDKITKN